MFTLPLADGARLLGVHPKTLCHWLKQANIPLAAHPGDARITCVPQEGLQQVASLHGRLLQASQRLFRSRSLNWHWCCFRSESDVVEQRITALEALLHQLVGKPMPDPPPPAMHQAPVCASRGGRQLLPVEQLARSRMPPLIEYSQQGTYVIVSSQEGELHLVPDSAQWFDWLATISSFRFVGPAGRFTACRESKGGRGWIAHRSVHQRCYKRSIGVTDRLTIASREQTAATLLTPAASL